MTDIQAYIQNPVDFKKGVELLASYGGEGTTIDFLSRTQNPAKNSPAFSVLLSSLSHLSSLGKGTNMILDAVDPQPLESESPLRDLPLTNLSERLKDLVPERADAFAKMKSPHITNEQRKALAETVCMLSGERRELWKNKPESQAGDEKPVNTYAKLLPDNYALEDVRKALYRNRESLTRSLNALENAREKNASKNTIRNCQRRIEKWQSKVSYLEGIYDKMKNNG